MFPNIKKFIRHFFFNFALLHRQKNLANYHICGRKIDNKIRAVGFKTWGEGRQRRDRTNRKFDDTETRRQLPDGNGFGHVEPKPKRWRYALRWHVRPRLFRRTFWQSHVARGSRIISVGYVSAIYIPSKLENAPPSLLLLPLARLQSDFNRSGHVTGFGRRSTLLHFGYEESCCAEQ